MQVFRKGGLYGKEHGEISISYLICACTPYGWRVHHGHMGMAVGALPRARAAPQFGCRVLLNCTDRRSSLACVALAGSITTPALSEQRLARVALGRRALVGGVVRARRRRARCIVTEARSGGGEGGGAGGADAARLARAIAQLMQRRVVRAGAWSRHCSLGGNVGRELNPRRSRRECRGA